MWQARALQSGLLCSDPPQRTPPASGKEEEGHSTRELSHRGLPGRVVRAERLDGEGVCGEVGRHQEEEHRRGGGTVGDVSGGGDQAGGPDH